MQSAPTTAAASEEDERETNERVNSKNWKEEKQTSHCALHGEEHGVRVALPPAMDAPERSLVVFCRPGEPARAEAVAVRKS